MGWNFLLLGVGIGIVYISDLSWYWYSALVILWAIDFYIDTVEVK